MADVAQMPGVWQQLKLISGLRWHILRNGLQRKNNRWDLIGMIWAGSFSAVLVLGLCFVFYEGIYALLVKNRGPRSAPHSSEWWRTTAPLLGSVLRRRRIAWLKYSLSFFGSSLGF